MDLDIQQGLTNPPRGIVTWRAVISGGVEARSVVAFPHRLTARAALSRGILRASGKLLLAGKPRVGVNVHLAITSRDDFADAREVGVARTSADGSYALQRPLAPAGSHLTLIAYVNFYVGPCQEGCVEQTVAPPAAQVVAVATR